MNTHALILSAIVFLAFAPSALAQTTQSQPNTNQIQSQPNTTGTTLINPLKGVDCSKSNGNCLEAFLLSILDFVIKIGTIVVILMLVYIGYLFVVAQGNSTKIEEARKALLWTIIGALILIGAKAIQVGITETVKALSVP